MVTSREECTTVFGIPEKDIYVQPDDQVNRVLCQQYSQYAFEYGEEVCQASLLLIHVIT